MRRWLREENPRQEIELIAECRESHRKVNRKKNSTIRAFEILQIKGTMSFVAQ